MAKGVGIEGFGTKGSYHLDSADKDMSVEHLKDTLEYNLRHAEEHLKKAREASERLHNLGEECRIPKSVLDLADYFKQDVKQHANDVDGKVKKITEKLK